MRISCLEPLDFFQALDKRRKVERRFVPIVPQKFHHIPAKVEKVCPENVDRTIEVIYGP